MIHMDDEWRDRAACQGQPAEFFFARSDRYGVDRHDPAALAEGKRICNGCPVREECLDAALDGGDDVYGLWGGTTKREREALRRRIRRVKCPVCLGTDLHADGLMQVCGDCGQSWTITRPSQARLKAEEAA
jgi:WhiB family redox-sensing transcriptional regulator